MTGKAARKVEGRAIISAPIVGDGQYHRVVLDMGGGQFAIARAIPGLSEGEAENTFDLDRLAYHATLVFEGNPDAQKIKGLGRELAGGLLMILSTIGAVQAKGAAGE